MDRLESRRLFAGTPAAAPFTDSAGSVVSAAATATPAALVAPVVVSPGSTVSPGPLVTTLTPTFTWKPTTGVAFTGYQINLYDVTTTKFVSYFPTGTAATSFTVPSTAPLTAGNTYVWNLRLDNGNVQGPPSTYLYFQTPAPVLTAPVVIGPGTTASPGPVLTTLTPTFTWKAVTGVNFTSYQINLYDATTNKSVSYFPSSTATSFTVPSTAPLTAGNAYVWNLRLDDGTVTGPPSTYLFFQTPAPVLTAPVAVSPGSATSPGPVLTTADPTFAWHAVTGVAFTGYQVNIENLTTNTFTSVVVGPTVTSYTPTTPFAAGDKFVWNVRLVNGTASGPPSTYLYFQTPAPVVLTAPVAVAPGSTTSPGPILTTADPTFTWHAVTGVAFTGYQVNIENLTTNVFTSVVVGPTVTSYTPTTPFAAGDKFVWNVRLVNGAASGPPSTYLYFQTPAPVVLTAPVAVAPGTTTSPGPVLTTFDPTFTWKAVTGVAFAGYQVNIENLTTNVFTSVVVGPTVTSYTPTTPFAAGDKFVWNVRLVNGNVSGPPSAYLYFQTPTLPAPVILGPGTSTAPGAVLTTLTPTFTWKPVTGVAFDTYQINLFDITTGLFRSIQVANTQTSYTPPAGTLTKGDAYVWNLRLKSGATTGLESQPYLYFVAE